MSSKSERSCFFVYLCTLNMRRIVFVIVLLIVYCMAVAQDNGVTMKPNYRKIARVLKSPKSPYYLDSLKARFERCDTSLTVDDMRCIYYSSAITTLRDACGRYGRMSAVYGSQSLQANEAWTQYQMMVTAIWSTGNGSKHKPLHVVCLEDAYLVAEGYKTPVWFKIKGLKKFKVVGCCPPTAASRR